MAFHLTQPVYMFETPIDISLLIRSNPTSSFFKSIEATAFTLLMLNFYSINVSSTTCSISSHDVPRLQPIPKDNRFWTINNTVL